MRSRPRLTSYGELDEFEKNLKMNKYLPVNTDSAFSPASQIRTPLAKALMEEGSAVRHFVIQPRKVSRIPCFSSLSSRIVSTIMFESAIISHTRMIPVVVKVPDIPCCHPLSGSPENNKFRRKERPEHQTYSSRQRSPSVLLIYRRGNIGMHGHPDTYERRRETARNYFVH